MAAFLDESIVEQSALDWFQSLGYTVSHGPHIAPGGASAERDSFGEVVLAGRLRGAIRRLNPAIPEEAREEVAGGDAFAHADELRISSDAGYAAPKLRSGELEVVRANGRK